jgi:hypothetical protein
MGEVYKAFDKRLNRAVAINGTTCAFRQNPE